MLQNHDGVLELMISPIRSIEGRVYYYVEGSGSPTTLRHNDKLKSFTIERIGEDGKFFGFGICSKAIIKILDKERVMNITDADMMRPLYVDRSAQTAATYFPYPKYYVSEVNRDETTNELTITSYDVIYEASNHTVSELTLPDTYTIRQFVAACATLLGANGYTLIDMGTDTVFNTSYKKEDTVNFEGTETIREALNAVAEATQTIYYMNSTNALTFKRLNIDGDPVLTIDKSLYFSLDSYPEKKLTTIHYTTELDEDGIPESTGETGYTQIVKNNPFWDKREDAEILVENALAAIGGITITPFNCSWRGNTLLEIGDKIALVAKDDSIITTYVLNDTIEYDGSLSEKTQWNNESNTSATQTKSANLGELVKETYARVDKVNKTINMVVSEAAADRESITNITQTIDTINSSVKVLEDTVSSTNEANKEEIAKLYSEVESKMSKDDYTIAVKKVIEEEGTSKVITSTGFKFDETGLTVSKSGSEIETTITEDGMKITKDSDEVLTVDNVGVNAINLTARNYLIIGTNSRFEDYNGNRTGCFWVGG